VIDGVTNFKGNLRISAVEGNGCSPSISNIITNNIMGKMNEDVISTYNVEEQIPIFKVELDAIMFNKFFERYTSGKTKYVTGKLKGVSKSLNFMTILTPKFFKDTCIDSLYSEFRELYKEQ